MKTPLLIALLSSALTCFASAADSEITNLTGKVYSVDLPSQSFELLKATEYDPKTLESKSRVKVIWNEETQATQLTPLKDFSDVKPPEVALISKLTKGNFKNFKAGKPFLTRAVTIYPNRKSLDANRPSVEIAGPRNIVGQIITEGDRAAIQSGKQTTNFTVNKDKGEILRWEANKATDLQKGNFTVELTGKYIGDVFHAHAISMRPLEDPTANDNPKLPRVLVIGDSISMNYHAAAKKGLANVANYHRINENGGPAERGASNTELWLGNFHAKGQHWDVIQFNHGLHDLKQPYDPETKTYGDYVTNIADYQEQLRRQISILKKTGAKLIWCNTTPVQSDSTSLYSRRKGASAIFNQAALEVIHQHPEILITDLHGAVTNSSIFDKWRTKTDIHFYEKEEQQFLGETVAAGIKKALASE